MDARSSGNQVEEGQEGYICQSANITNYKSPKHSDFSYELSELDEARKNTSPEEVVKALKDAAASKPRVFNIVNFPKSQLNICILGCQGSNKEAPKRVAE